MTKNTGARYETAIDGTPRAYRDIQKIAMAAAAHLKTKQPHSEVTIRDLERAKSPRSRVRWREGLRKTGNASARLEGQAAVI
jgi:hypothetical protein